MAVTNKFPKQTIKKKTMSEITLICDWMEGLYGVILLATAETTSETFTDYSNILIEFEEGFGSSPATTHGEAQFLVPKGDFFILYLDDTPVQRYEIDVTKGNIKQFQINGGEFMHYLFPEYKIIVFRCNDMQATMHMKLS